MTEVNTHKEGYKHTPLGWIPENWSVKSLGDDIEYLDAGVSVNSTDAPLTNNASAVLKTSAVSKGILDINQRKAILSEDINRAKLNPRANSIIISRMNTPELVGECCFVQETHENIFLPDRLWQTRFYSSSKLNIKWLNYLLNSSEYKFRIKSTATGTSNSMKNISKEVFLTLPYKQPTNNEQLKIATILSVWDDAILQTQNLIFQLKQRDKILSEKLLLGTIRLPGFKNQWIEVPLGKVFSERVETNRISLPLLSITADRGVILQSEGTKKDTSNEDKTKYRRICPGDIGYNTMRMWQGRSALSDKEGLVSPAYTILKPNSEQCAEFYAYLFKVKSVIHKFHRNSQGLVDDTLNCKYKDFARVKIKSTSFKEQQGIANVLTQSKMQIKLYQLKLDNLQMQKKGLMQKLLNGEIRVTHLI